MRKKSFGIWDEFTWSDVFEKVKYVSLGLVSLGLERGDRVAILGDNDPEWFWAEIAVQSAGGIVVGMHADGLPDEVKYIAQHSDSKFVICQDQEQVDKLLQIKKEIPLVKKVIYWNPLGMKFYCDLILMYFDEVLKLGSEFEKIHPAFFEDSIASGKGSDLAVFLYTSGTTGLPKGAMLTYNNMFGQVRRLNNYVPVYPRDEYLSFTLPGWIVEQTFGLATSLLCGQVLNFPEEAETVQENLRELSPATLLLPPPLWIKTRSLMQVGINDSTAGKRLLYNLLVPIGYRHADYTMGNQELGLFWKILYRLSYLVLFRPLKDKHGLHKVRRPVTAGSLIGPETYRLFHAIGVSLRNVYGITETGVVTAQRDGELRPDSVGLPIPGVEIRISNEGEILVGRQTCFEGYHKDASATEKAFSGGWYHTGDAGYVDDNGHLIFIDRMKDLKELANGTKFSPQYMEIRLKFSPYIKEAVVVEDVEKNLIAAIINIDFQNVGNWAEKNHISYTTFTSLSQLPQVGELIRREVERVNGSLPPGARIQRFVCLHKEFDADEAELTRTKKLRRNFMEQRYHDLIQAIFSNAREVEMKTEVIYQDGRRGMTNTTLRLYDVELK
jgi:long-chain acyl-CoA synthetase